MFTYSTIAVATDFSVHARAGIDVAAAIAAKVGARRLHLIHAVESTDYDPQSFFDEFPNDGEEVSRINAVVAESKARLERLPIFELSCPVTSDARLGQPAEVIVESATEAQADLIVLTTRNRSDLKRFVLGSVAGVLMRTARCPVLVLREGQTAPFGRVLAAVDRSPVAGSVVKNACALAGEVQVLSVFQPPAIGKTATQLAPAEVFTSAEEIHRDAVSAVVERAADHGLNVKLQIVQASNARRAIMAVCADSAPDLLVVGTSSHSAWHELLIGSTAKSALSETDCAILVVPFDAPEPAAREAPPAE